MLTKEQYEKLQPWEKTLKSAYKNSFVHMSGSDFNKVAVIYNEIVGKPLSKAQMNCNTCRLNTLRKLGELYEEYITQAEEKEEKKEKKTRTKKLAEVNKDGSTD